MSTTDHPHNEIIGHLSYTVAAHRAAGNAEQAADFAGPLAVIKAARSGKSVEEMRAASRAARAAEAR